MKMSTFYRRLLPAAWPFYVGDNLSVMAVYALILVAGWVERQFFDGLSGAIDAPVPIWILIAVVLARGVFSIVSLFAAYLFSNQYVHRYRAVLFKNMLNRLLKRPAGHPLPNDEKGQPLSTGATVSIFRDDAHESVFNLVVIADLITIAPVAIAAMIIMISISWSIALAVLIPQALVVVAVKLGTDWIQKYRKTSREATSAVTGSIGEIFGSVQAIKVANAEARVIEHFSELNKTRGDAVIRDQVLTSIFGAISRNMITIGTGLILLFSASSIQNGTFTIGDFALFVAYIWPITQFMNYVGTRLVAWQQVGVSINRMQGLMDGAAPDDLVDRTETTLSGAQPVLENVSATPQDRLHMLSVRGLSYTHPQSENGVFDIDLDLPAGSVTVVTGRIGSGKTTLVKTLLGLYSADSGTTKWNGVVVEDSAEWFTPPRCAYTSQVPRLFSESLQDNILMGKPATSGLQHAIHTAVLESDVAAMDNGLATLVGPKGTRLSGGQVQRSATARMLVREPSLYVFDDLSSALDVVTEETFWTRFFTQHGEKGTIPTCLIVSHRPAALKRADCVVVLENGRIAARGKLADVVKESEYLKEIL